MNREHCLTRDYFEEDLKDWASENKIVKCWWGLDQSIKVDVDTTLKSCKVTIKKVKKTINFKDFEELLSFIENCVAQYSSSLVYCAFQNLYALLQDNNAFEIIGDIKQNIATISCKMEDKMPMHFDICGSIAKFSEVRISSRYRYNGYVLPTDVSSMQAKFLGTMPNQQKCNAFWKKLCRYTSFASIKENKNRYSKIFFWNEEKDQWIKVHLDKTGDTFSLKICTKSFYGGTLSHAIDCATWNDLNCFKIDSIFAQLNDDDVAYCCDVSN